MKHARMFLLLPACVLALACAARQEAPPAPAPIVIAPVGSASALRVQEKPADVAAPAEPTRPVTAECPKSCRGLSNPALESALAKSARTTRSCYNRALAQEPHLSGKLIVELTINEDGTVCRSEIKKNDVSPRLNECVTSAMAGPFPPVAGGCVNVVVPMSFVGMSGDGGTP